MLPQYSMHPSRKHVSEEDYCFLVSIFSMTDFLIPKRVASLLNQLSLASAYCILQ